MRGRRHGGAVLAAALVLALATAQPASAHNRFVSSDPADGATVPQTPSTVVLTFDEPAIALGTQVEVTGPDGPVQQGAAQLVDDTVRQPLAGGAPAGRYTVRWRVTAEDGHPITRSSTFTSSTPGTGPPAPSAAEPAPQPAPAGLTSPAAWPWLLLALALFALAGTLTVRRRRRERRDGGSPDVSGPAG